MEIKLWKELLEPYRQAVSELVLKFGDLRDEFKNRNMYSPIETVSGRVKSVSSILEKMERKSISFDELEDRMDDIAGVRIICQFVEDIDKVAALIERRSDLSVLSKKDYLRNGKSSGYRSYHLIVNYKVETIMGPKNVTAEIQIRTMAMNFWATTEHSLQYKYKGEIPPHVSDQLTRIAKVVESLDAEMSHVRSEIMDAQIDRQLETNTVKDILRNIENLYLMDNTREVVKIQNEFYRIFSTHDLEELERFSRELDILAEGSRAQSVEDGGSILEVKPL